MTGSLAFQELMFAQAADRSLFEQAKSQACEYMDGARDQPSRGILQKQGKARISSKRCSG